MRLIIDAALSPRLRDGLRGAGHDVVHLADYDMLDASDSAVLERARLELRIIVSADSDFAELLSTAGSEMTSLILIRHPVGTWPSQLNWVVACIDAHGQSLEQGCTISVARETMRVRTLPLGSADA